MVNRVVWNAEARAVYSSIYRGRVRRRRRRSVDGPATSTPALRPCRGPCSLSGVLMNLVHIPPLATFWPVSVHFPSVISSTQIEQILARTSPVVGYRVQHS